MQKLIIIIACLFAIFKMSAQTIVNDFSTNNKAYIRYGVEPTVMLTFGYQHNSSLGMKDKVLTTYGEWSSSVYRFGFKNSELKIGGIIPVFQRGNFKIVNNLGLSAGNTTNKHFEAGKFAVSDEIALGRYKNKWFIAATVEYEKIYLNHIEHTDFYRTTYYEDAQDGWYKGAGGMLQPGIEGGITLKQRVDIHLEIKVPLTEKFNGYGGSPFHVNLGVAYRF